MLSNGTNFAAIGAAVGEIYWNNQFLAFVFYYIRMSARDYFLLHQSLVFSQNKNLE